MQCVLTCVCVCVCVCLYLLVCLGVHICMSVCILTEQTDSLTPAPRLLIASRMSLLPLMNVPSSALSFLPCPVNVHALPARRQTCAPLICYTLTITQAWSACLCHQSPVIGEGERAFSAARPHCHSSFNRLWNMSRIRRKTKGLSEIGACESIVKVCRVRDIIEEIKCLDSEIGPASES